MMHEPAAGALTASSDAATEALIEICLWLDDEPEGMAQDDILDFVPADEDDLRAGLKLGVDRGTLIHHVDAHGRSTYRLAEDAAPALAQEDD